jgi:hypothetical protein
MRSGRAGLGTRTLQRWLADAGITFQQLVEDTRRELAHHYLKHSIHFVSASSA